MRKLRPLLIAWAAGLALWLLLGCVSLARAAWYARQGLAATQSLAAADFTPVGIQPYDAGEEGDWYISTDGDPQLLWQGEAYLDTVQLFAEHKSPPQAVMLYWKTPGQTDFSPRQSVYGVQTAPGVYSFDVGGVKVSEVRIDPDSQGGVVTRLDGVVFDPGLSPLAAFLPGAGEGMLLLFAPPLALAALCQLRRALGAFLKKDDRSNEKRGHNHE
ncbi:hypothetical protein [Candidatus Allofournierella excrementigallinarum]|uniref:hypothetical protein n=1 Tax=Candidatus Allofournierella excrementigallinarum TaxID=2838592 RepID=UPI00374FC73D